MFHVIPQKGLRNPCGIRGVGGVKSVGGVGDVGDVGGIGGIGGVGGVKSVGDVGGIGGGSGKTNGFAHPIHRQEEEHPALALKQAQLPFLHMDDLHLHMFCGKGFILLNQSQS
jgi:hypothetical protein